MSAVEIGSYVYVGENSIIGNNCILKDRVYVMPGSFLPPETVVPPMAIMSGNPGNYFEHLEHSCNHIFSQDRRPASSTVSRNDEKSVAQFGPEVHR